jgi:hypothetical protein
MRCFLLLLTVLTASNQLFSPLPAHPNCALVTTAPLSLQDIAIARPAVWAFVHQIGAPNALLCLQVTAAQPTQPTCVLLVQRSATHFTRYRYRAQRVDSSQLVSAALPPLLAQLGKGHYATECESISTAPTNWLVLAKQGTKLTYSLQFTDYYAPDFTAADRARLAPALALVRQLLNQ